MKEHYNDTKGTSVGIGIEIEHLKSTIKGAYHRNFF